MISRDTIDKVFDTARIEEVVGDFVNLKRRGTNLLGLCPFHNEKTPSFNVSPVKGIYKCFGCGKGGNAVQFIMDHEQMTFPEAIRYVARKYHIEIEEDTPSEEEIGNRNERESLLLVLGFAQKFFSETLLNGNEGKAIGLSYFKERGFSEAIITKFQLGYSPEQRNALSQAALKAAYKAEFLVKAGLSVGAEPNIADRFYGRVMFPVHNISGRVIAFGGRTLKTDKKVAKYINSPETEVYHKSKVLYGLFFAKKEIIVKDNCYLVEGYTDVISMHQSGIENVVASSGTSLTVEQIRLIKRYSPNITILYDGDAAGIKASFRGIDLVLEEGMNVKIVLFPDGEDPDSFSKKRSSEEFQQFIKQNTKDFITFKTGLLLEETKNDPVKKAGLIKDIVETIALIPDPIYRSVYVKECSRAMDIAEQTLLFELNKIRRKNFAQKNKEEQVKSPLTEDVATEPTETAPTQEKTIVETSEPQERDVIRMLMLYGTKDIFFTEMNEDNHPVEVPVKVAEFIIAELRADNIFFENPLYQQIFNEVEQLIPKALIPTEKHFTHHEDAEICKLAVDLFHSPYQLSKNWEEQHNIFTQTEDMLLKRAVEQTIYSIKLNKLITMITLNQSLLKEVKDEEELNRQMEIQKQLLDAKRTISSQLGRVILK